MLFVVVSSVEVDSWRLFSGGERVGVVAGIAGGMEDSTSAMMADVVERSRKSCTEVDFDDKLEHKSCFSREGLARFRTYRYPTQGKMDDHTLHMF